MMEAIKAEDLCNKFLLLKTTTQGDYQKISIDTFARKISLATKINEFQAKIN